MGDPAAMGPPNLAGPAFPPLGPLNNQMAGITPLPTIHEVRKVNEIIENEHEANYDEARLKDLVSANANAAVAAATAGSVPAALEQEDSEVLSYQNPFNVIFNQTVLYSSKVPICDEILDHLNVDNDEDANNDNYVVVPYRLAVENEPKEGEPAGSPEATGHGQGKPGAGSRAVRPGAGGGARDPDIGAPQRGSQEGRRADCPRA